MGFFSGFFKAIFQPVVTVVQSASQIVEHTTAGVNTVVGSVSTALAPIPVVGTVMAEAAYQVNNATDQVDNSMQMAHQVVADAGILTGSVLDLNGDNFSFALTDILQYQAGGTVDFALTNTVTNAISSVFDFG